ncbi:MAG TPA: metal ABC transporter permease, partial [Ilumatobacteraceae bacterium]
MTWLTDPYHWWIEPFTDNPFMRDALLAALLAVLCTSVIGTWVVLRGLSFLGDALAHGVLPGIAIAFVLGTSTTVGALVAALVMVAGINVIRSASPLPDDASIGVLFVGFLALAVVIMSSGRTSGAGDLARFLFGSINAVDTADLAQQAVVAAITVGGVIVLHR